MINLTCYIKEGIQPFERDLALRELRAVSRGMLRPIDGDVTTATAFSVDSQATAAILREELAYWRSVDDGADELTVQVRRESTANLSRGRRASVSASRRLRYGTHGLHEYRGKFFPQLVRAAFNIAQLSKESIVLDPMCGSGTTLVEACLSGRRGHGFDMNPLSVFITDTKCRVLSVSPESLFEMFHVLAESVLSSDRQHFSVRQSETLPSKDQSYLSSWFDSQVLSELDFIYGVISQLPSEPARNFYKVCMSNILRTVSHQREEDLRVRRTNSDITADETRELFLSEAKKSTLNVVDFLEERGATVEIRHDVKEADAKLATRHAPALIGKTDAIVTSPPYATALPYIDTDRLSLIYLGLLPRLEHRRRDMLMIGNREVTVGQRAAYLSYFGLNRSMLPEMTSELIERIHNLNSTNRVGFRRRNLSALLSKYFFDMREVFRESMALLKPGGELFLVVGNNRTLAGGVPISIRTADHLGEIATSLGFNLIEKLSMDMLVPRGIFKRNAVPSEFILRLARPQ